MVIRAINPQGTEKQQDRERHWQHDWVPIEDISKWMPKAVMGTEDGRFMERHSIRRILRRGFLKGPVICHSREGKRQRQLSTDTIFPEGRTIKRTFPTTSSTAHLSLALNDPSPMRFRQSPSISIIRCKTCPPLYRNKITSIGLSSSALQGNSMTSSIPSRSNGNIDHPLSRNRTL